MNDGLGIVKRYVDDVNVGIEFNQLIDSDGDEIIAEVYVLGSDALADTVSTGTPTLAGLAGNRKRVQCDFSNLPSAGNYILKFRTEEAGVLATAPLVIFGIDAFTVGDDLETETYPIVDFTLADRIALDTIGTRSFQGYYNAATNTPDLDVSPGAIYAGYQYSVNAAGTFFTEAVEIGDLITANIDNPSVLTDWTISQVNLDDELYMLRAIFDPTSVVGDAFDMDNMVEGATTKILTDTERTKLAGIETGATADMSNAEIKSAYEANADTNAFTDAEQTKLAGIEANATADQTGAEIKALYEAEANTNAYTDAEQTKVGHITVTQAVDLDTIETNSNASKVKTDLITVTQAVDLDTMESDINTLLSTGILTGGAISIGTGGAGVATTFTIAAGTGVIVDNTVSPNTKTIVSWSQKTDVAVTDILTNLVTFVAIDSGGSVIQSATDFTPSQMRDYIVIGIVVHSNLTTVNAVNQTQIVAYNTGNQFADLLYSLGLFNISGNVFSANGANSKINKSAGTIFRRGANYSSLSDNPHIVTTGPLTQASLRMQNQTGAGSASTTDVDVANYDVGGVTTAISPANRFSILRVFLFQSNLIAVQRGQAIYTSMAEAKAAIQTEPFVTNDILAANGLLRGFIVARANATDLSNPANAFFIDAGKFGGSTGVGGLSVSTLQNAYNNSSDPEILTDSTNGAVSIRRGSAADTDDVFEILNNAGVQKMAVTGEGKIFTASETASRVASINAGQELESLDTATYPSLTELAYMKGVTSAIQGQINGIKLRDGTATGTDTYALAVSNYAAYATGDVFVVKFTNANTGAATLNINSIGAIALKKNVSEALEAGDIAAGQTFLCVYDGTNFQVIGIRERVYETIALSDEESDIATGQVIFSHRIKWACTIAGIVAYVDPANAPTGSTIILDIKKNGSTIFSTKITIDATEATSATASTAYALSTTTFAVGDNVTYHIDQVGSTNPGSALKVDWTFRR